MASETKKPIIKHSYNALNYSYKFFLTIRPQIRFSYISEAESIT